MSKTQKLSILAMTVAVAMLLSFIESKLPSFTAVPGIKIGLANIAVMVALYKLGLREAIAVSTVRVLLISLLFGSIVGLLYGLSGAVVSLSLMAVLKRFSRLTPLGVSVVGGVAHNIAQIAVACVILETARIAYYLPVLLLSGTLSGIAVGVASAILIKKLRLNVKNT